MMRKGFCTFLFMFFFSICWSNMPANALVPTGPDLTKPLDLDSVPDEFKEEIASLDWQTNLNIRNFGSPEAKKGGTLVCVQSSRPPTLRTTGRNSNTVFNSTLEGFCYETMLALDPITYDYSPNLAKRWAVGDDKKTFYFELDENAKWSDGNPVVANDIVQTWVLYTDKGLQDPFSADFYSKYEKPIPITDRIVKVSSRDLNWRAFMSIVFMTILPGHILENLTAEDYLKEYEHKLLPGTGPYTYLSSPNEVVSNEISLARRHDWWQKDYKRNQGYYNFNILRFLFIADENLIKEKFKKGEIDWMQVGVAREWHQEFIPLKMPAISKGWIQRKKVYTHQPVGTMGLAFNIRKPPFDDIRVRKAIAHLYNRELLIDRLFFNEYELLDSFYPNSPYESPNTPKMRYDPEKAVQLLEEAGWLQKDRDAQGWLVKDGQRFVLELNLTGSSDRIYTIVQEDFKEVGIDLQLKKVTWATDLRELGNRNFNISLRAYTGLTFPNPESSMHSKFADLPNNNNIWGFKNARVDEICDQYNLMFDPAERIKAVQEIDQIACENHLYAFGWYAPHTRVVYWNKFGMPDCVFSKSGDEASILSLWWYDDKKMEKLRDARINNKRLPREKEIVKWWDEHYPREGAAN